MTTIIRIKVEDLDDRFLNDIKENYKGADLEIRIHYKEGQEISEEQF